jgi:PAS domain S-box-containing protein
VSVTDDPGAVLTCDVRRRLTDVSPAALTILERPRSEVMGRALEDLAPADRRLRTLATLAAVVRGEPGTWHVVGLESGAGQPIALELACRPLDGSGGHLFALRRPSGRGAARPVLKHREREVFARIAEGKTGIEIAEELRALADTMRDGWITGDATGSIRQVNVATCELLGWGVEDLVGHNVDEITCVPSPLRPLARRPAGDGPRQVHEECLLASDGRDVPIEYTTTRFSTDDVLDRWTVVFRVAGDP